MTSKEKVRLGAKLLRLTFKLERDEQRLRRTRRLMDEMNAERLKTARMAMQAAAESLVLANG